MLTTMSSTSATNGGPVGMSSWPYNAGGSSGMLPISGASPSMCSPNGAPGNTGSQQPSSNIMPSSSIVADSGNSLGAGSASGSSELLNIGSIKCEYSPNANIYSNSSTPDLEPETRARANTWHAERKRPDRQMLESLLEEDDDTPEDSLSDIKPESLSPHDGSMLPGSPMSSSGTNSKKISRRNAWGNLSYADLITKAIECSPEKRLTLSQIYDWMVQNVPYFKDKGDTTSSAGWKNSIRHNLSLHTRFMRVHNESSGKSSWWVINPDASKSGKSPRRRAASIDTKNFERKRGRVKKRLQGTTSTDFGSTVSSRNMSTSSINSDDFGAHRSMMFGSSTASLETRLQQLASSDPCWSEATPASSTLAPGGSSSAGAFDMDMDSSSMGQAKVSDYQMFGAPQAAAPMRTSANPAGSYGSHHLTSNAASSAPSHIPTAYLQLQGSYHLSAVANTPNHHHHHHGSSAGNAGQFHSFHSPGPFGQHQSTTTPSYMPSYQLQVS